jgi:glycosyltransferase involved in cell wall biosynthesis
LLPERFGTGLGEPNSQECIIRISVITVAFNAADSIVDALRSVQAQTHPDVNYIVVDGASTDGTLQLIRSHLTESMTLISEPDCGIYDAMNKGVAVATGDVICFLNADDVYANAGILARVSAQMEQERLDALFGDVVFFNAGNPQKIVRRYRSRRFRPERIAWGWMPAHPALFLRREVYQRVGPFRTDYHIAGDFEFVARAFGPNSLLYCHISEILVRMRTGGVSTGGWRNTVLLNREVLRACSENGIQTNMLKILSKYPVKFLEYFHK